jgi:mono/diheme cytochrome c family protein
VRGSTAVLCAVLAGGLLAACSEEPLTPLGQRGRQVYLGQCISCHNSDPATPGAVGPAIKGSSAALLEARVLRGTYPPGYEPKRPTKVMQPMPQLAGDLPALVEYLR